MDSLALTFQISNVFTEQLEERLTANKSDRIKQIEQLDYGTQQRYKILFMNLFYYSRPRF